jgi:hypothetical protein
VLGSDAAPTANLVIGVAALDLHKLSSKQISQLKDRLFEIDPSWTIGMARRAKRLA